MITLIQCELSVFVIWVEAATSGHIMDTVFAPEANVVLHSVAEAAKAHGQRIYEGLNFLWIWTRRSSYLSTWRHCQ